MAIFLRRLENPEIERVVGFIFQLMKRVNLEGRVVWPLQKNKFEILSFSDAIYVKTTLRPIRARALPRWSFFLPLGCFVCSLRHEFMWKSVSRTVKRCLHAGGLIRSHNDEALCIPNETISSSTELWNALPEVSELRGKSENSQPVSHRGGLPVIHRGGWWIYDVTMLFSELFRIIEITRERRPFTTARRKVGEHTINGSIIEALASVSMCVELSICA